MKKIIRISLVSFLVLTLATPVLAKNGQVPQAGQTDSTQQRVQDPSAHDETVMVEINPQSAQVGSNAGGQEGAGGQAMKAVNALNRVAERTNNPEVGEQIRSMVEAHEQIQARSETALKNMSQRNSAFKFILGPSYKNIGQVRSDLNQLRNNIAELEANKEDLSLEDTKELDSAIAELEAEAREIEIQLETELSSFSLFGWVGRIFNRQS